MFMFSFAKLACVSNLRLFYAEQKGKEFALIWHAVYEYVG